MLEIFVDADACPVKQEVLKVAKRHALSVTFVSNSSMRICGAESAKQIVVESRQLDAVDDWIAEHAAKNDIVITADIPLAYRIVKNGARGISSNGEVFTEENIGHLLAMRDLMTELRNTGEVSGGGPRPFQKEDRSNFLHSLDQVIQSIKRERS